ncbi:hypothetical protein NQ317_011288 [Molorchus minor]|uniref:Uncharacterized protein n=1 Tax=Molorchus minor TaxID=1323400 RepID=A0ABQ9JWQ8_9CUCU|nr:hypothetical protein NQ317_011288 [Molorchus minor]
MSKPVPTPTEKNQQTNVKATVGKLDRKYRHSLQPKSDTEPPPIPLRHTQSHRYVSKGKRNRDKGQMTSSTISPITEAENSEEEIENGVELKRDQTKTATVSYDNEKSTKNSKPKKSDGGKAMFSFENAAFEGNLNSSRTSNATIRTNSSRAPSVQSLEVVREQYCCCAKRTKCERRLLIVVTILTIIIIVLVIVVAILANNNDLEKLKVNYLRL